MHSDKYPRCYIQYTGWATICYSNNLRYFTLKTKLLNTDRKLGILVLIIDVETWTDLSSDSPFTQPIIDPFYYQWSWDTIIYYCK